MAVKARARELGIVVGILPTGPLNAITDVAGVRVGHATLNQGRQYPHRRHRDSAPSRQPVS